AAEAPADPAPSAETEPSPQNQVGGEAQIPAEVTEAPEAPAAAPTATGSTPVARTTNAPAKPQPIPAQAPQAAPAAASEGQDVVTVLKGMAKTLASNMDASLTVPTATSVRTIPAKLMIDNRIVINNHLKRARG